MPVQSTLFLIGGQTLDEGQSYYHVRVRKGWFRGKDIFAERLYFYERLLVSEPVAYLPLNAGNMIYTLMRRLEVGVEWRKQAALMLSYRNLVYRLSYTVVSWHADDAGYLALEGQKSDVLWTLSFLSQVYNDSPIPCMITPVNPDEPPIVFAVQNGDYVSNGAIAAKLFNSLPDIWDIGDADIGDQGNVHFDPTYEPADGEMFAISDGRVAQYIRMDNRFYLANTKGAAADKLTRHNVSASFIKDFENMVYQQTKTSFDLYRLRYTAFMNKVQELEQKFGGFEPTAYDVLPIAERGLPVASADTISRTNAMDRNSLKYIADTLKNNLLRVEQKKVIGQNAVRSLVARQRGYENEYRMYLVTGTPEELAGKSFKSMMFTLYGDFARLDAMRVIRFPQSVYRDLCNVPSSGGPVMTEWERQRIRLFGKGYIDFLDHQISALNGTPDGHLFAEAKRLLNVRYIKAKK